MSTTESERIESFEKSITTEIASAEICQAVTPERVKIESGKDPLLMKLMDKLIKA